MAGRWGPIGVGPGAIALPDYAPRAEDYVWAARELGDVPARSLMPSLACAALLEEAGRLNDAMLADAEARYFGIPVESLGREG